jgi:hypothetical protein
MSYKTKIVAEGSGYIGHLFSGDQIVFTTNNHKDPVMVSRELGAHVGRITAPPVIPNNLTPNNIAEESVNPVVMRNISSVQPVNPSTGTPTSSEPVRRCCGR